VGVVDDAEPFTPLLHGILVIDVTPLALGMTGRILADLGATVVRVDPALACGDRDDRTDGAPTGTTDTTDHAGARTAVAWRGDPRWDAGAVVWRAGTHRLSADDPRLSALLGAADLVIEWVDPSSATTPGAAADAAAGRGPVTPAGPFPRAHTVRVRISAFGAVGPRADWAASDLGVAAASGNLWATGDADRPPVRCAAPLSLVHTGPEAAFAALSALAAGVPGPVDVSMAETMTAACLGGPAAAATSGARGQRAGAAIGPTREIWRCRDGWVSFGLRGGAARVPSLRRLADLAAERGDRRLSAVDWDAYHPATTSDADRTTIVEAVGALFAGLEVAELERLAAHEGVLVAPILDAAAITRSEQLAHRGFFGAFAGAPSVPRSFVATRRADDPFTFAGSLRVPSPALPGVDEPAAPADRWERALQESAPPGTTPRPWDGTVLVELGSGVAGPLVGRDFAEQGATVVRVETASRPDFLRVYALGPDNPHGLEGSPLFTWTNAGKLDVTLDLKTDDGRRLVLALVARADAVVENFTPSVLDRLGLGYHDLRRANPSVVLLSTSFHGQTGPRRGASGFGALGSALSGFNHLTGWTDREPIGPASTITDSLTPRFAATALAAALLARRRTGRGIHLDVAQVECALYALSPWLHWCTGGGGDWDRAGNRHPVAVPHGVYRCAGDDRWVAVAVWDDDAWARLRALVAAPGAGGPVDRFADVAGAEALLEQWTSSRTPDDAARALRDAGVEAVPVGDYVDLLGDATLAARGHFVRLDHDLLGPTVTERSGFRLPDDGGGFARPTPTLGHDNLEVFTGMLGLGPDEVRRLDEAGVIR
jgi:crotonobetainyl-CoA:carnitine CoA-transferase CaiB-like acyl-CoA transferase